MNLGSIESFSDSNNISISSCEERYQRITDTLKASLPENQETEIVSTSKAKPSEEEPKLTPFYLEWSFGQNTTIPIINLTVRNEKKIFYAAAHAGMIYNCDNFTMKSMQGHTNAIVSCSADASGSWVVTADRGADNTIVVWDTKTYIPVRTLFNPHPEYGTNVVGISQDAKYIVSVGAEQIPVVKMWLWTFGKEEPNDTKEMDERGSRPKSICFSPDKTEFFMITQDRGVTFGTWEDEQLKLVRPTPFWKPIHGQLTASTYVGGSRWVISVTTKGCAIIFGDSFLDGNPIVTNNKLCVKIIKLQPSAISSVVNVDDLVVTGNDHGHIRFYDKYLKIMYWCQSFDLDPISSISFNLHNRKYVVKDPLQFSDASTWLTTSPKSSMSPDIENEKENLEEESNTTSDDDIDDRSTEYEEIFDVAIPSDATIQRNKFIVRDFIIMTKTGRIGLINFLSNKCEFILLKCRADVTALELHPEKAFVIYGNTLGELFMVDYIRHRLISETELPMQLVKSGSVYDMSAQNEEPAPARIPVSFIKYAPLGIYLACGLQNGTLWLVDPTLLTLMHDEPENHTSFKITEIAFSQDSKYMATADEGYTVCLYIRMSESGYIFSGKYRTHYGEIVKVLFGTSRPETPYPRMLTVGRDRMLVEYVLGDPVDVKSIERIEQSAIPTAAAWYTGPQDNMIITAVDTYKYKLINDSTGMTMGTMLGPTFGGNIKHMLMLTEKEDQETKYMLFTTNKQIGIQIIPPDGNPYKNVGMVGHPTLLTHVCVTNDGSYLFTIGENDRSVLMWQINTRAVDVMHKLGGERIKPFFCLLEGGEQGWLYREMQDMFYYTQILLQGQNSDEPRQVSHQIPLSEIADLMRAVGFYPTEYEIENITTEVNYVYNKPSADMTTLVPFEYFVRLFLNHRPPFGISLDDIHNTFKVIADENVPDPDIPREIFLETLCEKGEMMPPEMVKQYLMELCGVKPHKESIASDFTYSNYTDEFNFLPDTVYYKYFVDNVLGLETNPDNVKAFTDALRQTQYAEPRYDTDVVELAEETSDSLEDLEKVQDKV